MKINAANRELNGRSTTMRWLREHPAEAEQRQWDIMNHNARAARLLVERVGSLPPDLRHVRLGSEMLQGYTEPSWRDWWQQSTVQNHLAKILAPVGERARALDVRLSFHPGQFCVLNSHSPEIRQRSREEFEYHVDMARWMGYGRSWHDHGFHINVHLSGRGDAQCFLDTLGLMTPEARNLIGIENDETTHGLDITLGVADHVSLVLDIHHHWVQTGEYIDPADPRVQRVLESWRGVRPVMHYSVSREDYLVAHDQDTLPDWHALQQAGYTRAGLRAHSDFYWNHAVNDWASGFRDHFDIECESKAKNLASHAFYQHCESKE
jgi:UV DNA damage repair endonuclease